MTFVRHCPRCKTARPVTELLCQGLVQDLVCGWSLFDILPSPAEASDPAAPVAAPAATPAPPAAAATAMPALRCLNGHPLPAGDFLCQECGEIAAMDASPRPVEETTHDAVTEPGVGGWRLGRELPVHSGESDLRLAERDGEQGVFKHYRRGIEPDISLYPALRALDAGHGVRLLDSGRHGDRAFEVWEYLPLGTLGEVPAEEKAAPDFVRGAVGELARALHGLGQLQIIHRDLKPANILVRSREPLDLALADFSTATVSEFDLQLTMSRQTTRYAAPETIVGTCSAASDWWSLGVVVLEMLTQGRGFEGVHERAFLLHLITHGLRVPGDLPEEWQELLKGLLTRDPSLRWGWSQVEAWLRGERGIPHHYQDGEIEETTSGVVLALGGHRLRTPEAFALAAVEAGHWEEARNLLMVGKIATWLQDRGGERDLVRASRIRELTAAPHLPDDARLAGAVMVLNENLPLCLRGEIVTPLWVLTHPETAWRWLEGGLPQKLRQWGREAWFVRIWERAERVRTRVRDLRIECDEIQLSAALLATSAGMLESRWRARRQTFPEADHPALAAMLERRTPSEEDLIILVSALSHGFRPAVEVLREAGKEARRAGTDFSKDGPVRWLDYSRAELLEKLSDRLQHFVRCGREVPDQWADDFRQDRRITLARALVLLEIPVEEWREPPRQEYVRNVLQFFHRRLVTGLQRGGLVRMTIARSSARLDLVELGGAARPAGALLTAVLGRQPSLVKLDPVPLLSEPLRERRLRRLIQNSVSYRRDTGINALYLGFPFIVMRDARATDAAKPRIAPVMLWPVRVEMATGQRAGVSMAFDPEREIRANPALPGLLGTTAEEWLRTIDEIRGRDHLDLQGVVDALAHLAAPVEPGAGLLPLPPATVSATPGRVDLHAAAVLFQCDFSGQTIAEDLKQLANGIPVQGTALEVAIRAGEAAVQDGVSAAPPEVDRYFTAASDPSQQAAVFRARLAPGLVVQGPPGTGKSQTIVNIVCDAIGRGERVLIVCQKQAALEVVRKRLETEGLSERLFFLKDTVADRKPALQSLRQQLEEPTRSAAADSRLQREREGVSQHVEALEGELNHAHRALHEAPADQPGRLPYREILESLMELETDGCPEPLPGMGAEFRDGDKASAWQLIAGIEPLASLWLSAKFEGSALHPLKYFNTDEAERAGYEGALRAFSLAETARLQLLRQHPKFFSLETPETLQRWLAEHEAGLRALPPEVTGPLARWAGLFEASPAEGGAEIESLLPWLSQFEERLRALDAWGLDTRIYERMAGWGVAPLKDLSKKAARMAVPAASFMEKISPGRWLAGRSVSKWLSLAGVEPEGTDLDTLRAALDLEVAVRGDRALLKDWQARLDAEGNGETLSLPRMRQLVKCLSQQLQPVLAAAQQLRSCPVAPAGDELRLGGNPVVYGSILDACHASLAMWKLARESLGCLDKLVPWFEENWVAARRQEIQGRLPGLAGLDRIQEAHGTLSAFQTFRARSRSLPEGAFSILARLREKEAVWQGLGADALPDAIGRSLRHEALREWKSQAESSCPSLLMERAEFERKVLLLQEKDLELREANRQHLSQCAASAGVSPRSHWDDVVMLTGQRARRLREVVDRGEPLGLFKLRPVWMVNPEMVSRLFPLKAGLFDVVIFDEASQLPVEVALPALFRARRVVVSGDEKQMPPSRFFGTQMESDEEEEGNADAWLDADDADADEAERERLAQAAGRREVKDCPDLLSLTQNLLPTATLEIHYRSKYRQLIDFSNCAFYAGRLNVPSRHPLGEVVRVRPIEVDRVDGEYFDQTNEDEAARVVFRLQEIWRRPPEERPSIGVVTFNLKQAELIEQEMEQLAEQDDAFRQAWIEEEARTQHGENMGFFVKNLENVQGDERDWILFSTTFGRDRAGVFRRNFGVLGQHGGERRLNVAVTRAREKVVVVTSMPVPLIGNWVNQQGRRLPSVPRDYLQGWLRYAELLDAGSFEQSDQLLHALNGRGSQHLPRNRQRQGLHSIFKQEVARFVRDLGYEPVPAEGDAFGVDFAIYDPQTGHFGLGIECDAPWHPVLESARARELWRPSVLAGSIPALHRVSSRQWYLDKQGECERLRTALSKVVPGI